MSWLLAFGGFAALVILHEAGHFVVAKAVGMRVERFALFFPPLILKVRRGETEYGLGCIPAGGYVRITGMSRHEKIAPDVEHRAYYRQKAWKRVCVIVAGPAVNLVLAFAILWVLFAVDGVRATVPVVGEVTTGAPAAGALRAGDQLLSVAGQPAFAAGLSPEEAERSVERVQRTVAAHRCAGRQVAGCAAQAPVRMTFLREGRQGSIEVTPRHDGQLGRSAVGLRFATDSISVGIGSAAARSGTTMWTITTTTVDGIVRLFHDSQARRDVSGVVGSYDVVRRSFEFDTIQAIRLLAVISLSLAIVNLFPILPLDGGHVFWALAEKLRGRPTSLRVMQGSGLVGILFVGFLFAVGLHADIGRLTSGEGFGLR
ncbi:MAG: M50 family metallopeptidase [Solirubrobacteraceae bacterium]|nr:M50 family metallopeptidase [Solirubrobacteraceae bacterium]